MAGLQTHGNGMHAGDAACDPLCSNFGHRPRDSERMVEYITKMPTLSSRPLDSVWSWGRESV